ncbi:mechanosensitive ion channel family protein [Corynebacterium cystitidis]|uniref:mechanosensitive ion channel family protein n=1 Tax=Corynebacterium cystitidis TaxID=35757 RepID=UPI00211E0BD2|nr:mechanosensitive ion channel family protein [Corynebacterium cystitidis]
MLDDFRSFLNEAEHVGIKVALTLAVIGVVWLLRRSTRFIVRKITTKEAKVVSISRIFTAILAVLAGVAILLIWFSPTNAVVIVALLVAIIVFVAMKDLVTNVFAFMYISGQSPFQVGDRIEVGETRGQVYNIGVFSFQVNEVAGWLSTATPTGRIVTIPNSMIFSSTYAVTKSDFPYVWTEIELPINHGDNVEKAKDILLAAGERELDLLIASANEDVGEDTPDEEKVTRENLEERAAVFDDSSVTPSVTLDMDGAGIYLTLRFLCQDTAIGAAKTRVWRDVYYRVKDVDDVQFSPNTVEITSSRK